MAKAEWGVKRQCPKCHERFFDLNNDPATCPNCEHTFEISTLYQSDVRHSASKDTAKTKVKEADDLLDDDVDIIDDDPAIDDELLEDDDDTTVSFDDIGADVASNDED